MVCKFHRSGGYGRQDFFSILVVTHGKIINDA